jgi:methionine-rich copper-binding protein CopC
MIRTLTVGSLKAAGVAALILLGGAAAAGAHAFLERADPRVGSTARTPPPRVKLWFTEGLEPAFSSARVTNETGQQVNRGDSQLDPSNPALIQVPLPPLPPGRYKVIWRVLSVDGHVTEGDFTFRVAP